MKGSELCKVWGPVCVNGGPEQWVEGSSRV